MLQIPGINKTYQEIQHRSEPPTREFRSVSPTYKDCELYFPSQQNRIPNLIPRYLPIFGIRRIRLIAKENN